MTEGKAFSEWLVASDIDGTLNNKRRKLPEVNLKAIKEFVDKGGNFTLASSRNPQSMWRHYRNLPITTPRHSHKRSGDIRFSKERICRFYLHQRKGHSSDMQKEKAFFHA